MDGRQHRELQDETGYPYGIAGNNLADDGCTHPGHVDPQDGFRRCTGGFRKIHAGKPDWRGTIGLY